jgi:hypothetical protein
MELVILINFYDGSCACLHNFIISFRDFTTFQLVADSIAIPREQHLRKK